MSAAFSRLALSVLCAALCTSVHAQQAVTSTLPPWRDAGSSHLMIPASVSPSDDAVMASANGLATTPQRDLLVTPAVHPAPTGTATASRHLAPPTASKSGSEPADGESRAAPNGGRLPLNLRLPVNSAYTVASALSIVVGLFLSFAWLMRRGSRGVTKTLPTDVVSVLGRVPLAPKQYADLLRVGNKLVLVAQTPSGPTTLTEVTDSIEVDRLVGLCQQADPHSTTKAFEQVFRQMAREPASGGFLGEDAPFAPLSSSMEGLRQLRTEAARV